MKNSAFGAGLALAGTLCITAAYAADAAEDEHHTIDEIVVTATPLARTVEQLAQPTSVLSGDALIRNQASSIGETIANQPGVSASYFGPVASRPVIRGQYGERVRVLANGLDALDASALSEDHAVSLDSILADRIEIVRGPATLLYGSGAAGGLVNIVDSRIHEQPRDEPFSGAVSLGTNSAIDKEAGALRFDVGNDRFVAHADFFRRDTGDIEIPGFAESARLRALEEEEHDEDEEEHEEEEEAFGVVENSRSETEGGALAATWFGNRGFLGLSVSTYETNYGVPGGHGHHEEEGEEEEEENVSIDLDQIRYDLRGDFELDGPIENINFRIAFNDYEHTEFEGDEIGTMFDTDGIDARIEMRQQQRGRLNGAFGLQYKDVDFVAEGDEAFVPPSITRQISVFTFQEFALNDTWTLQGSARAEQQDLSAPGLPGYDDWAFGASIGAIWRTSGTTSLAANLSLTERHPTTTELYAEGPHVAVQRFERGSVTTTGTLFDKERSANLDVTFRYEKLGVDLSVTGFYNSVKDYILLRPTDEEEDEFQVFNFAAADVDLYGFEFEALIDLFDNDNGHLHARLTSDFVFAEESGSGAYLPRMPPLRYGFGLHYQLDRFEAGVEAHINQEQDNVAIGELDTDRFTMLSAEASYRFLDDALLVYVRGSNLGDEDARRHTSALKDLVPLAGRAVHLGLRYDF